MWNANQMQNALSLTQDYIVCKMSELTGETIYQIDKMFTEQMLKDFNNAITSINSAIAAECGSMSCLSQVNLPPSQRTGTCKVVQYGGKGKATCAAQRAENPTWNPDNFFTCETDNISQAGIGICDPTDGLCYRVYFWDQAEIVVQKLLDQFLENPGINSFQNFNDYQDPVATLALATGSLVKVILLQQKVMLGMEGSGEDLKTFVTQIANQLEARYNDATSIERAKSIINLISFGNSTHLTANPCSPEKIFLMNSRDPNYKCERESNMCRKFHIETPMMCYSSSSKAWLGRLTGYDELYIESAATIRKSCSHAPQVERLQCKGPEFFTNGEACTYPPPGVGTDEGSVRSWLMTNGYYDERLGYWGWKDKVEDYETKYGGGWYYTYSTEQWLMDSCETQQKWSMDCWAKYHKLLNPGETCYESIIQRQRAFIDTAAQELSNELKETLQPVKVTIDAYRTMATFEAGMHPDFVGIFRRNGYPSEKCVSPAMIPGANSLFDEALVEQGSGVGDRSAVTFVLLFVFSVLFINMCM